MEKIAFPKPIHTVNKIGGANMSQLDQVGRLVRVLQSKGEAITLVVSAFQGVTDTLIAAMDELNATDYQKQDIDKAFENTRRIHYQIITNFFPIQIQSSIQLIYDQEYEKLRAALMTHKAISNTLNPVEDSFRIRDQVIGFGELMAAKFLTLYLKENGHNTHHFENIMCPKNSFGAGPISVTKLHEVMQQAVQNSLTEALKTSRSELIQILGGHLEGTPRGIAVDVGRSYSDTTAVNVAIAMEGSGTKVTNLRFWKDVDGVLTANPKDLNGGNNPVLHSDVSLQEALEMASAGSGLMQIDALALAARYKMDLEIRNIDKPEEEIGTRFSNGEILTGRVFKAIISNPNIDLISIDIPAMANREGFSAAISHILATHGISVDGIFTEGTSIGFSIPLSKDEADRNAKRTAIRRALNELKNITVSGEAHELTDKKWSQGAMASLSIIGDELKGKAGILSIISGVLGAYDINVQAVTSQDQRRITFIIPANLRKEAVQKLHSIFVDRDQTIIKDWHIRSLKRQQELTETYGLN